MTKKIITTLFVSLFFAAAINAQQQQTTPHNGASVRGGGNSTQLLNYTKQAEAKIAAEKKATFEKQQHKIAEMNRQRQEVAAKKTTQVQNASSPRAVTSTKPAGATPSKVTGTK